MYFINEKVQKKMCLCVCVCVSYLKGQKSTRHFGWKPLEVWVLLNSILFAALESISVSPHKQNNQAAQEERKRQKLSLFCSPSFSGEGYIQHPAFPDISCQAFLLTFAHFQK